MAAQIAICQLPRVEDRVLAMMWLLAEAWGRVTSSGTVLPVALTHDVLGELIGARRSTVTLALKELAEEGALFRQDGEWLLLKPPPGGSEPAPLSAEPQLVGRTRTAWSEDGLLSAPQIDFEQLREVVTVLHESHVRSADEIRSQLDRARQVRARNQALRERIATERSRRRLDP
jgi:hypothetical protein